MLAQAIRERPGCPGRPGIRVIAKQFGAVSPMTVQNVGCAHPDVRRRWPARTQRGPLVRSQDGNGQRRPPGVFFPVQTRGPIAGAYLTHI